MHIGPFDYIMIACVAIAAIYQAADAAVKQSDPKSSLGQKLPRRLRTSKWGYLPLILIIAVGIILIVKATGIVPETKTQFARWPNPYSPTSIIGKTYRNERVVLDGYSYSNCEFYNVTFVYNGTTPIQLSNNKVLGGMVLASDNQAVTGALMMATGFGLMKDDVGTVNLPPGAILERGKHVNTPQ